MKHTAPYWLLVSLLQIKYLHTDTFVVSTIADVGLQWIRKSMQWQMNNECLQWHFILLDILAWLAVQSIQRGYCFGDKC